MKLVSLHRPGPRSGTSSTSLLPSLGALLDEDLVLDFAHEAAGLGRPILPHAEFDLDGEWLRRALALGRDESRRGELLERGALRPLADVSLAAPVPRPGKVICIGLNYRDHALESKMELPERPLVFSKFPTSVTGPDALVAIPPGSENADYEAELGVVIGRRATQVSAADAYDHVLGYTCVNDVSARDFQFADGQWQRGKSPDTFCPLGPAIVLHEEIRDPHTLDIRLRLNGVVMQDSNTRQLIFTVPELIEHLSSFTTLEPGDVIATGTPYGCGFARTPPIWLKSGDVMEVEIERLGVLRNQIA